jgi:hypothetical protein
MAKTTILRINFYTILTFICVGCNGTAQTAQDQNSNIAESTSEYITSHTTESNITINEIIQTLPLGHKEIRRILGADIGQMQFDTQAAKTFRHFITNSLLETTSYNSDSGYGNYHRTSGSGKIQLCADGTYVEALYSEVIVDTSGSTGSSSGVTYIPGYWEVAALPNNMFVILFYSQHPYVLEDFPNGFQPWVVPKYGEDFVALPSGELYKRTANMPCN